MKIALDSNVLAYSEDVGDTVKRDIVIDLIYALLQDMAVIPVQVPDVLFNVLVRKAGRSRSDAKSTVPG